MNDQLTPPKKRFTLTVEIDAEDYNEAANRLEDIAWDLHTRKDPLIERVGGDYVVRMVEHPDGLCGAAYEEAFSAWAEARRLARKGR